MPTKGRMVLISCEQLAFTLGNQILISKGSGLKDLFFPLSLALLMGSHSFAQGLNIRTTDKGSTSSLSNCSKLYPTRYEQLTGYHAYAGPPVNVPVEYTYSCTSFSEFRNHSGKLISKTKCFTRYRRQYDDFRGNWIDQIISQDCNSKEETNATPLHPPSGWHPPMVLES